MRIVVKGGFAEIVAPIAMLAEAGARPLREGLQDGGNKVRTRVRRALKTQTNVKTYGAVIAHVLGAAHGLVYEISGTGKGLAIEEFPVRLSRSRKMWVRWSPREHWRLQQRVNGRFSTLPDLGDAGEVYAAPWNRGRTFVRSFVSEGGKLRQAIPGTGKRKWQFRALYGPSMAKEIVKDEALVAFEAGVATDVLPAIERRLARTLAAR